MAGRHRDRPNGPRGRAQRVDRGGWPAHEHLCQGITRLGLL